MKSKVLMIMAIMAISSFASAAARDANVGTTTPFKMAETGPTKRGQFSRSMHLWLGSSG